MEVSNYSRPSSVALDEATIFLLGNASLQEALETAGGRFDYSLEALEVNRTRWTRLVTYFQNHSADVEEVQAYKLAMAQTIFPHQERLRLRS